MGDSLEAGGWTDLRRGAPGGKSYQDPDSKGGILHISGRVSYRPSHPQVRSFAAPKKWRIWSLGIKNASLQTDGFRRGVFLRAPTEWGPSSGHAIWEFYAPAYGLGDAPVAFRRPFRNYLLISVDSSAQVGLRFQVSPLYPYLYFAFREKGGAVGDFATHIGDILGCGELDSPTKIRVFSEYRFRAVRAQNSIFALVGMESSQEGNFSVKLTQEEFTTNLKPLLTSPGIWAARQQKSLPEGAKLRQRTTGKLCGSATVSGPDICARPARTAPLVNSSQGSDVDRTDDPHKTAKVRQQATILNIRPRPKRKCQRVGILTAECVFGGERYIAKQRVSRAGRKLPIAISRRQANVDMAQPFGVRFVLSHGLQS